MCHLRWHINIQNYLNKKIILLQGGNVLTYLNYFAMIVGYATIIIIIFLVVVLTILILRDKYKNWKWEKEREKRAKEQQKETTKEPIKQITNIEASTKQ
mgnify:CR=1 FL=1